MKYNLRSHDIANSINSLACVLLSLRNASPYALLRYWEVVLNNKGSYPFTRAFLMPDPTPTFVTEILQPPPTSLSFLPQNSVTHEHNIIAKAWRGGL